MVTDTQYDQNQAVSVSSFKLKSLSYLFGHFESILSSKFNVSNGKLIEVRNVSKKVFSKSCYKNCPLVYTSLIFRFLQKEVSYGRSISDACLRANIQHVIYSTRMHVYASIGLRSDPCDAKAHVSDYLSENGVPKTLLVVPFFYEDFLFGVLKPAKTDQENLFKIGRFLKYLYFVAARDIFCIIVNYNLKNYLLLLKCELKINKKCELKINKKYELD